MKKTEEEKQELTRRLFARLPELPESFEQDVLTWALPGSRYLFFKNGSEFSTAICTNCGKTVHFPRALLHTTQEERWSGRKHRDICPECGSIGITVASRYGHTGLMDSARYMLVQAAPGGGLWVRLFDVWRKYPNNTGPFETQRIERIRVYLNAETHERYRWKRNVVYAFGGKTQKVNWELSGCINSKTDANGYYNATRLFLAKNAATVKALADGGFLYADFPRIVERTEETGGVDLVRYLALYAVNPNIEKLIKFGFWWIVEERCNTRSWKYRKPMAKYINWRAKDLRGFFKGERMDVIRALAKYCHGVETFLEYEEMRPILNLGIDHEDFLRAWGYCPHRDLLKEVVPAMGTPARALKYVRQQMKRRKAKSEEQILNHWGDYVRIAHLCGITLRGKEYTPPDLYKAHDEMAALYRAQTEERIARETAKREKALAEKFAERLKVLKKYCFAGNGLLIRPCETPHEMTEEGVRLRHCVGTYLDRHANGTSNIFLIRKADEPGEPYYTLELSEELNRVVQWYGYEDNRNIPKDPAVEKFIKDWMQAVVLPLANKVKIRLAAAG